MFDFNIPILQNILHGCFWNRNKDTGQILTLKVLTPQNGQTHSNKLSANSRQIFWVCLTIFNWFSYKFLTVLTTVIENCDCCTLTRHKCTERVENTDVCQEVKVLLSITLYFSQLHSPFGYINVFRPK